VTSAPGRSQLAKKENLAADVELATARSLVAREALEQVPVATGKTRPKVRALDQAAVKRWCGEGRTIPVGLQLSPCFERPLSATLGNS
jgi:hypothetical protein